LVKRSFEIADQFRDKILVVYEAGKMPEDEVERKPIVERQVEILGPNYTYDIPD